MGAPLFRQEGPEIRGPRTFRLGRNRVESSVGGRIAAQATIGPAGGPRRASSTPFTFTPLVLVGLLAVAVALGAALSLVRARHVAFYLLAGAGVGVAASFLAPPLIGGVAESVLAAELISLHAPAVLAATAVAGLIDGAVFWLIVRHFD